MAESKCQKSDGYGHKFVSKLHDSQYCAVCLLVVRKAKLIPDCGHVFCESCLNTWMARSGPNVRCPVDNMMIRRNSIVSDLRLDREIRSLKVYCDNTPLGCKVIMELVEYEQKHHVQCPYNKLECRNKCGKRFLRSELACHETDLCPERRIICDHCKENSTAKLISAHNMVCELRPISCPRCNVFPIVRNKLPVHYSADCQDTLMLCFFSAYGCKDQVKRKDLTKHYDVCKLAHLRSLAVSFNQLKKQSDDTVKELKHELWGCKTNDRKILDKIQQQSDAYEKSSTDIQSEISRVKKEIQELKSSMDKTIQSTVENCNREIEQLKMNNNVARKAHMALKSKHNEDIKYLNDQVATLSKSNDWLVNEVKALTNRIDSMNATSAVENKNSPKSAESIDKRPCGCTGNNCCIDCDRYSDESTGMGALKNPDSDNDQYLEEYDDYDDFNV